MVVADGASLGESGAFRFKVDDRVAVATQAVAADTLIVGAIIDTLDYESLEYVIQAGVITTGTVSFVLEEGDDSGLSDAADVASAKLVYGTLPAIGAAII